MLIIEDYKFEEFSLTNNPDYAYKKVFINEKCQIDRFLDDIAKDKLLLKELATIIALMDKFNDFIRFPETKFKTIQNNSLKNLFEFKSKHLRIYVVKVKPNVFLIQAGFKKTQPKDIENFIAKTSALNALKAFDDSQNGNN